MSSSPYVWLRAKEATGNVACVESVTQLDFRSGTEFPNGIGFQARD
jgi:hypothetical protein